MPQTRWLIYNRNLILTVLKAESPDPGYQYGHVLVRAYLLVHSQHLLIMFTHGGRGKGAL